MIPKVSRCGTSFKGLFAYCMTDKNASTNQRVDWTRAVNVPDLGRDTWKAMVHTVRSAEHLKRHHGASPRGRKLERPVFTYSLSWAPDQNPDQAHMEETALKSLAALGLEDHEAWIVSHNDTAHPNLHVIVNRVHPLTGYAASIDQSARTLQRFASNYERATKIYCLEREKNRRATEANAPERLADLEALWESGLTGQAFLQALEKKGFKVFQGRKRPVFVCPEQIIFNPVRALKKVTARELRHRLSNVELRDLPSEELCPAPYSSRRASPKPTFGAPQSPPS